MANTYEYKELKEYKGYGIDKAWQVDFFNKKVRGTDRYLVSDADEYYVGDEFETLADAHRFIDSLIK